MSDQIISHVSTAENKRICTIVHEALRKGELVKPTSCSWCGDTEQPIHAHHPDYNRPLMVVWICRPCHQQHHETYRVERTMGMNVRR